MPTNSPTAMLRDFALGALRQARDLSAARFAAELELEGQRVEVIIERDVTAEHITVKVGAKSRPRTIVASSFYARPVGPARGGRRT